MFLDLFRSAAEDLRQVDAADRLEFAVELVPAGDRRPEQLERGAAVGLVPGVEGR
jgi:hypothetical protein